MIGAPIGIDNEVGANVGPRRLDEDVNAARCSGTAHRVADDPADRIARCDRPRSNEFFAFLEHDVGNLPRCGVNLEQGSIGIGILLDGIEIAGALRFHARSGVGSTNTGARVGRLNGLRRCSRNWMRLSALFARHGLGRYADQCYR